MKISKSKQELARIISENGGWDQLANLAFYGNFTGECFMLGTDEYPIYDSATKVFYINERDVVRSFKSKPFKGWHQTILSREEYFHLYPAPVKVVVENKTTCHLTVADKPTIEQLAADYRNAKDCAERKQQEADAAKADADAKLKALELAGEANGLLVSPITAKQEPELVITDWRQWRVGDVVSWSLLNHAGEFEIISVHHDPSRNIGDFEVEDKQGGVYRVYGNECRFIRRP